MAKIGIMGGTFNPIHSGHLQIARMAIERAGLSGAIFVPTGHPPHKPDYELASPLDRLNMTALAIEGIASFSLSTIEADREGTSYSVDTMRVLKAQYPGEQFSFVIGGDTLASIHLWNQVDQLHSYCDLIVAPRPRDDVGSLRALAERVSGMLGFHVSVLDSFGPDISSTQVREIAARGADVQALTPAWDYIAGQGLYGSRDSALIAGLRAELSPKRLTHTRETARSAVRLAIAHGIPPSKAQIAGLLHDCAKGREDADFFSLIDRFGIYADAEERRCPWLLHAPAGSALARLKYGVDDPEILEAIRWHTTGRAGMTRLEKVIYLADFIEPGRRPVPALEEIRALALANLDAAVKLTATSVMRRLREKGYAIHRNTIELANESLEVYHAQS